LVGHLFDHERKRLDAQRWVEELGVAPYVRMGREWVLNKTPDEACVFLDTHGLCKIHAKYGEAAKPFACRIFPFSVRPVGKGWQVSFRFDCPSSSSSAGKPIQQHVAWLRELTTQLEHRPRSEEDAADLQPGCKATPREIESIIERYTRWLTDGDRPPTQRWIGAARITATLYTARFEQVRGPRLTELLDLLFQALPAECVEAPPPPSRRQCGMLRQLAFAHAEHVSHAEAGGGTWKKLGARWRQLRRARRFLKGRGPVPPLQGFGAWSLPASGDSPAPAATSQGLLNATFAAVEAVKGAHDERIEGLLLRYAMARLNGRSCFGEGYYGRSVFEGLAALWLSVAAVGWLARYRAVGSDRCELDFDDVACAVGVVDRAATRLPALGSAAERIRTAYLTRDSGLARLMHHFAPFCPAR
jgi:lysine-N-methylase